eukprot:tig00000140_g8464.t1
MSSRARPRRFAWHQATISPPATLAAPSGGQRNSFSCGSSLQCTEPDFCCLSDVLCCPPGSSCNVLNAGNAKCQGGGEDSSLGSGSEDGGGGSVASSDSGSGGGGGEGSGGSESDSSSQDRPGTGSSSSSRGSFSCGSSLQCTEPEFCCLSDVLCCPPGSSCNTGSARCE